jgi:hypothetical protein
MYIRLVLYCNDAIALIIRSDHLPMLIATVLQLICSFPIDSPAEYAASTAPKYSTEQPINEHLPVGGYFTVHSQQYYAVESLVSNASPAPDKRPRRPLRPPVRKPR